MNQKVTKHLPFKNYKSECIYWGHMCIFISNMKFLSLILWPGGLCTDDNVDTNADDNDNYAPQTNQARLVLYQMSQLGSIRITTIVILEMRVCVPQI